MYVPFGYIIGLYMSNLVTLITVNIDFYCIPNIDMTVYRNSLYDIL